jgi:hypothetical protein
MNKDITVLGEVQMMLVKTEEAIGLHWKTEFVDGVSYVSSKDNVIIQEDPKVDTSDIEESMSNVADQEKSVTEVKGVTDDRTQSENLEKSTEVITIQQLKYLEHPEDIKSLQ